MQILPDTWSDGRATANQNGVYQVNPAAGVGQQFNMCLYDVLNYGYDLGLALYPIWNEERRQTLNDAIVNHFMWREIAGETPCMFIWLLNTTLVETMPALNPLFEVVESAKSADVLRSERVQGSRSGFSKNATSGKQQAYSSTNPKETMVGKDPTLYYDAGQFSDSSGNGSNDYAESYESSRDAMPLASALQLWASAPTNPLEALFASLEPCFRQLVRPNFNIW